MKRFCQLVAAGLLFGLVLPICAHQPGGEKVPLDKLPKEVTDAVKAKFPMADLKRATKETDNGKTFYEIMFNNEKVHLHALVTTDGKLFEIHRHVEQKDVPEKVTAAVNAKYPKAVWEGVHERADPSGKILGYEVTVEVTKGSSVELDVDLTGKILRETKLDAKKDAK